MKIQLAVATVALSLVGALGANAQSNDFSVVVSPNPLNIAPGSLPIADQAYTATITNISGSTDQIVGDSIGDLPGTVTIVSDGVSNQLGTTGPISLAPGASVPATFDLGIGAGTSNFVGDLTVYDNAGNGNNVASVGDASIGNPYGNFAVNTTPEPGSLALLGSSVVGSGAVLLRRRRK